MPTCQERHAGPESIRGVEIRRLEGVQLGPAVEIFQPLQALVCKKKKTKRLERMDPSLERDDDVVQGFITARRFFSNKNQT